MEPFAGRPDIPTTGFLDTVPRILNALILVLRHQQPPDVLSRDPERQERICEHARTRQQQGIPAEGVMREYQVLRDVILLRLQRNTAAEDRQGVRGELNRLMDEAMRITVNEYVRLTRPEETQA